MKTSQSGIDFIADHEGLRLTVYADQAGLNTIGYGHLIKPGEEYLYGAPITQVQAKELLAGDLVIAENAVNNNITRVLNQNEFDALVSLTFNIGAYAFRTSTVCKRINADDTKENITEAWLRWDKVTINGELVSSRGLYTRREDEVQLFFTTVKKKVLLILAVVVIAALTLAYVYKWI